MPFWPICCESDAILFKTFCTGDRAGVLIWENFHPGYRDIGRKNRDLGIRASPANTRGKRLRMCKVSIFKIAVANANFTTKQETLNLQVCTGYYKAGMPWTRNFCVTLGPD